MAKRKKRAASKHLSMRMPEGIYGKVKAIADRAGWSEGATVTTLTIASITLLEGKPDVRKRLNDLIDAASELHKREDKAKSMVGDAKRKARKAAEAMNWERPSPAPSGPPKEPPAA